MEDKQLEAYLLAICHKLGVEPEMVRTFYGKLEKKKDDVLKARRAEALSEEHRSKTKEWTEDDKTLFDKLNKRRSEQLLIDYQKNYGVKTGKELESVKKAVKIVISPEEIQAEMKKQKDA